MADDVKPDVRNNPEIQKLIADAIKIMHDCYNIRPEDMQLPWTKLRRKDLDALRNTETAFLVVYKKSHRSVHPFNILCWVDVDEFDDFMDEDEKEESRFCWEDSLYHEQDYTDDDLMYYFSHYIVLSTPSMPARNNAQQKNN